MYGVKKLIIVNFQGLYQCVASNNVGSVMKNSHVIVIRRTKVTIASDDGPQEIAIQARIFYSD